MKRPVEELPLRLFGLTLDDVDEKDLRKIVDRIKAIKEAHPDVKPIVRVVFDFNTDNFRKRKHNFSKEDFKKEAEDYRSALETISQHAFIMGEIVDSSEVFRCHYDSGETTVYVERTQAYAEVLGDLVKIWEIGNEINGEWVGWLESAWKDPTVTLQKMTATRVRVKNEITAALRALKAFDSEVVTAVTFYFNEDDAGKHSWTDDKKRNEQTGRLEPFGQEYGMMKWASECQTMFAEVDYIFISYYQDDNYAGNAPDRKPIIPDSRGWARIFSRLHSFYPNAKLGFGEVGPQCYYLKNDQSCRLHESNEDWEAIDDDEKCSRTCPCSKAAEEAYVNQYYSQWNDDIRRALTPELERLFVGGYFYWYFKQDSVNQRNSKTIAAFRNAFANWYRR
jgi:hypothetical protein